MAEVNESMPESPTNTFSGRIVTDQTEGCIKIYNESDVLIMKMGYLGLVGTNQSYGIEYYDTLGNVVIRDGYLGNDASNNPLFGRILYDENGVARSLDGKQTNGF